MKDEKDLAQKSLAIETQARALAVQNQDQYDQANVFLRSIKELQGKVKETFRPIVEKAHLAHKEALAQEKKHLKPLTDAYSLVNSKMLGWLQEQERVRAETERKLQEEAEKKRQELLVKADTAREKGREAWARVHEMKAEKIVTPELAPTVDKGGAVVKKLYHAEVYDLMALVKAIAAGHAPLSFVQANMPVLNAHARSLKEQMSFPGVRAVAENNLSLRKDGGAR